MAEGLGAGLENAVGEVKKNWLPFLILGFGLIVAVLWYDHKKGGALTTKIASIPVIGKLFA